MSIEVVQVKRDSSVLFVTSPQSDKFQIDLNPGAINFLLPGDKITIVEYTDTKDDE